MRMQCLKYEETERHPIDWLVMIMPTGKMLYTGSIFRLFGQDAYPIVRHCHTHHNFFRSVTKLFQ